MADFASVADVINRYSIVHRTSCFEQSEAKRKEVAYDKTAAVAVYSCARDDENDKSKVYEMRNKT